ncbi:thioester domain-containing protein [Bacillus pumilus]|uniref:thioester domain-containing protein n=1 Tax=Bacillus pumilus TaxID=1408 RepID=UPI0009C123FC|nr:thioester domain-containing protein [Bacillus pumilus]
MNTFLFLGGGKFLMIRRRSFRSIVLLMIVVMFSVFPKAEATEEGVKTFGINYDGYLEMNGEILYMSVDGKREKATLEGLIQKGDKDQELLLESDIEENDKGVLSFIFSFFVAGKAKAAAPKIEYKGAITYRGSVVGDFRVDGKQAFCFQHSKASPPTGSKYKESVPYENEKVQRALYYGWGGQGNIFADREQGIVITSLILDRLYSNGDSGKNLPGYEKLWDLVLNGKDLNRKVRFTNTKLTVAVKGNKQISETTKLNADKENYVTVSVPIGITLVNETSGKKVTEGKMKVYGEQKIHLEADLDKKYNYSTGELGSNMKIFQPLITKPSGGNTQVLGYGDWFTDPNNTTSFAAVFKVRQKKINVQHIDKYSGEVLEKESYTRNIGSTYSFAPKKSISKGKEKFIPVNTNKKTGTLGSKDVTIKFYYNLERSINVNYFDDRTGEKIKESKNYKKVRGEKYSEKHSSIKSGEYKYRYVRTDGDKESGIVGSKNIIINYYYDKPLAKLGFEKLQIYTAQWEKGLPIKVYLSKELNYKSSLKDMTDKKITVALYRGTTKVTSKTYTAKELPKKINMTVPAKYLKINDKALYTVKFTGFDKNDFKIAAAASTLSTDGYAASEKTIKASSSNGKKLSYKGVVMTEKTPTTGKVYYERLAFPLKIIEKKKTGYGFMREIDLHYENEIGGSIKPSFDFEVPTRLVDSYLTYKKSGDRSLITMEQTKAINKKQGETSVNDLVYELPHINVERHTGSLFSDGQVESKDKRISYDLVDGGRKFYSPIWAELGKYDTKIKSKPMGVNLVKTEVAEQLELYASMYAHMDSKTIDQDEVLLKPVYADNPFPNGLPEGWTKKDLDWVMSR